MTEPVTANRSLVIPNTGDLTAAWGTAALNPNFQMLDSMFGGTTTLTLTSGATTVLLTTPPSNGVWGPGSTGGQSVNSMLFFTGAQTGNAVIQFTLPGYYMVHNKCTGTSYVQLAPAVGLGNKIGVPPGKKCHVYFDGTDMDYVNMPDPGMAYDLHTNTTTLPPWMLACTVAPYLIKDGTVYNISTYPALAQYLGSTYGGNGATTFGVPDERARMRIPVDSGTPTNRVTSGGSGIAGATFGAAGGNQLMQSHRHINTITDPGHTHTHNAGQNAPAGVTGGGSFFADGAAAATINSAVTGISLTNVTTGSGSSQNMPPAIVNFLALIKT